MTDTPNTLQKNSRASTFITTTTTTTTTITALAYTGAPTTTPESEKSKD